MAIARNSTDHLLPKLASATSRISQYMWLLFGAISIICLALYLIVYRDVYNQYMYTTKMKVVKEDSLKLPDITVCYDRLEPLVPFDKTTVSNKSFAEVIKILEEQHQSILENLTSSITETIANFANESVLSCTFDGEQCEGRVGKRSYYSASKGHGKCIELTPLIRSSRRRKDFSGAGLSVEMYIESTKETFPHDSYELTLTLKSNPEKKMMLPIGYETDVSISETRDMQLPRPYNNCLKLRTIEDYHSELYKQTWNETGNYNEK